MTQCWVLIYNNDPLPDILHLASFVLLLAITQLSFGYFFSVLFLNPYFAFGVGHVFYSYFLFYLS